MYDALELGQARDLANLADDGLGRLLRLSGSTAKISLNLGAHGRVLHRLGCHAFHAGWDEARRNACRQAATCATLEWKWVITRGVLFLELLLRRCRAIIGVEERVGTLHEILLLLHHHGSNLLTHWCLQEFLRQVDNIARDPFTEYHGGYFISEVVAVMVEDIVGRRRVLMRDALQ